MGAAGCAGSSWAAESASSPLGGHWGSRVGLGAAGDASIMSGCRWLCPCWWLLGRELVPRLASLKGSWQWRMWLCAHPGEDFMLGQCGEMNPTGAHIQIPSSSSSAPFLSPISHHSLSPQPLPPQVPAEGTPWQCCHHGNDVPMLLTTPCPEGCRHLLSLPIHPPTVGVAPEAPPRSDPRRLSLSGHGGTPKILLVPLPWAVPPQLLRALHVP